MYRIKHLRHFPNILRPHHSNPVTTSATQSAVEGNALRNMSLRLKW